MLTIATPRYGDTTASRSRTLAAILEVIVEQLYLVMLAAKFVGRRVGAPPAVNPS